MGERLGYTRFVTAGSELRRLSLPGLHRGQISRARLIGRLAGRFDRRATLVVAGPGFGKSTLLAQALHENALAPRGEDHFVSCTAEDSDASVLVRAIANALDLPLTTTGVGALISAMGSLPLGTCLVLDDLHEVTRGSSGHAALVDLVDALPLQCSLMIGSRLDPDIPLSRWIAQGRVETLTDSDLAYTREEIEQVTASRISPTRVEPRQDETLSDLPYGGWPALVELALVTGGKGSDRYLREVVLRDMPEADRYRIAVLDLVGGGDAELLSACLEEAIEEAAFAALDRFPMMQRLGQTGLRPHALWQPVLAELVSASARISLQRRAAGALMSRGLHDDAMRLFARCEDWDGVASVIADACRSGCTQVDSDTLERWRNTLPVSEHDRPEAKLVAGISARQQQTFASSTADLLAEAANTFREREQVGAEIAALAELAFVAREQGDTMRIFTALGRMFELEALNVPQARTFAHLFRAVIADSEDDDAQLIDHLAKVSYGDLSPVWESRIEWLRGHAHLMLGQPELGRSHAERSATVSEDDFLGGRYLVAYVAWWNGPDARAIESVPDITIEKEPSVFDQVYGGSGTATLHAYAGNLARARACLRVASDAMQSDESDEGHSRPEYRGLVACARAAVAVAEGDDARAAADLHQFFDDFRIDTVIGRRAARRWIGPVWVLMPEARTGIEAMQLGPAMHNVRTIAAWFADMRDGKYGQPPIYTAEQLIRALPLLWAVEALARVAAIDADLASALTEQLVALRGSHVRDALRAFTANRDTHPTIVIGAKRLLASVPVSPSHPLTISLLGPLQLKREAVIDAPELRRGRVRQLIVTLAVDGPLSREVLADRLWPEIERGPALQNLRQTINYVHKALEPERGPGDAPFVLRASGELLSLVGSPWIELDIVRFREACDEAARLRRTGVHTQELGQLEAALSMVRGEPLMDVAFEEWASSHIRSLTVRIASAAQRAAEMRFAMSDHEQAREHAALCVRFDPWCESAHSITTASLLAEGRVGAARDAFHAWRSLRSDFGAQRDSAAMSMLERRLLS